MQDIIFLRKCSHREWILLNKNCVKHTGVIFPPFSSDGTVKWGDSSLFFCQDYFWTTCVSFRVIVVIEGDRLAQSDQLAGGGCPRSFKLFDLETSFLGGFFAKFCHFYHFLRALISENTNTYYNLRRRENFKIPICKKKNYKCSLCFLLMESFT